MKWIERRIRNSKTGRKIVRETETRVAKQMKHGFVVVIGEARILNTYIKIPTEKDGLLLLGDDIIISGCYIDKKNPSIPLTNQNEDENNKNFMEKEDNE